MTDGPNKMKYFTIATTPKWKVEAISRFKMERSRSGKARRWVRRAPHHASGISAWVRFFTRAWLCPGEGASQPTATLVGEGRSERS